MKLIPDAKMTSDPIAMELKNAKKYNYYGEFDEIKIADGDLDTIKAGPIFKADDGSCENFALEYHIKIKYEPIADSPADVATFKLTGAYVDVVYGKIVPGTKDTPVQITRQTSLHFYTGD